MIKTAFSSPKALASLCVLALVALVTPVASQAQDTATTLLANRVEILGNNKLIASGDVTVTFGETTLKASRITYTKKTDSIDILGPITLKDGGGTVLLAERAELSKTLNQGLLHGARLVFERNLQLEAAKLERHKDQTTLSGVSATSCYVCAGDVPLWQIRASTVTHDQIQKQLYFKDATLDFYGTSILWLPGLRLPDPTLKRATGFLVPEFRTTSRLKSGLKVPYYVAISRDKDLTLTPYVSTKTVSLEADYRQAFTYGTTSTTAAISNDTLQPSARYAILSSGDFSFQNGYSLDFDLKYASDNDYLADYGYGTFERLENRIRVQRIRANSTSNDAFQTQISAFRTQKIGEDNNTLPPYIFDLRYDKIITLKERSTLFLSFSSDGILRPKAAVGASARDMLRVGGLAQWRNTWTFGPGLQASTQTDVAANVYKVFDDPDFTDVNAQLKPSQSIILSWPLFRSNYTQQSQQAAKQQRSDTLTPQLGLIWSNHYGPPPPNEDLASYEYRPQSLFEASPRYGEDALAVGLRAVAGVTWHSLWQDQSHLQLSLGHSVQLSHHTQMTAQNSSHLAPPEWMASAHFQSSDNLYIEAQSLWSDRFSLDGLYMQLDWRKELYSLNAGYNWRPDPSSSAQQDQLSELRLSGTAQLTQNWSLGANGHYDLNAKQALSADFSLKWQNECLKTAFSVSHQFPSSANIKSSTDFGLTITLGAFDIIDPTRLSTPTTKGQVLGQNAMPDTALSARCN